MNATEVTNEAIARVEANANPEWLLLMYDMLYGLAQVYDTITTELLWDALDEEHASDIPYQHEPRALGPVMRYLVKDGVLAPTNEYVRSGRKSMHRRPLRVWRPISVWRSLHYEAPSA